MYGPTVYPINAATSCSNINNIAAMEEANNGGGDDLLGLMVDQIDDTCEADFESLRFNLTSISPRPIKEDKVTVLKNNSTHYHHGHSSSKMMQMMIPQLPASVLGPLFATTASAQQAQANQAMNHHQASSSSHQGLSLSSSSSNHSSTSNHSSFSNFECVDDMLDEILELAETDILADNNTDLQFLSSSAASPATTTYNKTKHFFQQDSAVALLTAPPPPPRTLADLIGMSNTILDTTVHTTTAQGSSFVPKNDFNNKRSIIDQKEDFMAMSSKRPRTAAAGTTATTVPTGTTYTSKMDEKIPFHTSSSGFPMPAAPAPSPYMDEVKKATTSVKEARKLSAKVTAKSTKASSNVVVPDECRFRSYQNDMWYERFQDLIEYKKTYGDCLVPHNWPGNVPLAQWVKRQRYQYKLLQQQDKKETSTMSEERLQLLNDMGFIWDSHNASWEEKFTQLVEYHKSFGHCNVSGKQTEHRPLCIWVKCQRRQRKFMEKNQKSTMTQERIERLDALGFDWNPRNL